jgi:hypothetical protein
MHQDFEVIKAYINYVLNDKHMDPTVKNYFEKVYPGVFNEVLRYLQQYPTGWVDVSQT